MSTTALLIDPPLCVSDLFVKIGHISRSKCSTVDRHALFPSVNNSRTLLFASIRGAVERVAERVNIICHRACQDEGCCRNTMVTEVIWRGRAVLPISLVVAIPTTVWGDIQSGLLETLYSGNTLRRSELAAVRCDQ